MSNTVQLSENGQFFQDKAWKGSELGVEWNLMERQVFKI